MSSGVHHTPPSSAMLNPVEHRYILVVEPPQLGGIIHPSIGTTVRVERSRFNEEMKKSIKMWS